MSLTAPGQAVAAVRSLGCGVSVAFSGRAGGVSTGQYASLNLGAGRDDQAAVAANRATLAAACGLAAADLTWMRQVHSAEVCYIGAGTREPPGPVDAMFTDVPGRALCVLAADCVPVLIADPQARIVGAAHSGREGLFARVVPALVSAMTAAGARPASMRALTGPAICGSCYEVPAELQERVAAVVPQARCVTRAGTSGLDLTAGVAAQLAAAGVTSVEADGRCTSESAELFSYRRDRTMGRQAGLIWLAS